MRYFIPLLKRSLLRSDTKEKLANFVETNPDCILSYYRAKNTFGDYYISHKPRSKSHHCSWLKHIDLSRVEVILKQDIDILREQITIPFNVLVLYVAPNTVVRPHQDSRASERQCSIIDPVNPGPTYTPTMFYNERPDKCPPGQYVHAPPDAVCETFPALVNLQELHAVKTSDSYRLNFQVYFGEPYTFDTVSRMIENGTLFKN